MHVHFAGSRRPYTPSDTHALLCMACRLTLVIRWYARFVSAGKLDVCAEILDDPEEGLRQYLAELLGFDIGVGRVLDRLDEYEHIFNFFFGDRVPSLPSPCRRPSSISVVLSCFLGEGRGDFYEVLPGTQRL